MYLHFEVWLTKFLQSFFSPQKNVCLKTLRLLKLLHSLTFSLTIVEKPTILPRVLKHPGEVIIHSRTKFPRLTSTPAEEYSIYSSREASVVPEFPERKLPC
jgi:hypothetical protein